MFSNFGTFYCINSKFVSTKVFSSISVEIPTNLNYLVNPICGWKSLVKSIRPTNKIEIHSLRIYKCGVSTTNSSDSGQVVSSFHTLFYHLVSLKLHAYCFTYTCAKNWRELHFGIEPFWFQDEICWYKMQTKSKEKNSKLICRLSNV